MPTSTSTCSTGSPASGRSGKPSNPRTRTGRRCAPAWPTQEPANATRTRARSSSASSRARSTGSRRERAKTTNSPPSGCSWPTPNGLRRLCDEAYGRLYDDDSSAMSALAAVWKRVSELRELDPRFGPYVEGRDAVEAQLDELAAFLREYGAHIDSAPDRLQEVEDRLASIERLKRKYGPTLRDVIDRRSHCAAELAALDSSAETIADLERRLAAAGERYASAASQLSSRRRRRPATSPRRSSANWGAWRWAARASKSGSTAARSPKIGGPRGASTSPSSSCRRILGRTCGRWRASRRAANCPRLMLALKTLASTDSPGKTLIFDEVDAGIGGRVADVVGQRLQALGRDFQVLCITHLPQIAACGHAHYRVTKSERAGPDGHDGRGALGAGQGRRDGPDDGRRGADRRREGHGARDARGQAGESEVEAKGESEPGRKAKGESENRWPRRYLIETFGCQMNFHDSERMAGLLEAAGYEPASEPADADVIVLNTCTVREKAEDKVFSRIGELRGEAGPGRQPPVVAVTGCLAQQEGADALPPGHVRRRRRRHAGRAPADAHRRGTRGPRPARSTSIPTTTCRFPSGSRGGWTRSTPT